MIGDLLAGVLGRIVGPDAKGGEHAVGDALADFVGDRPLEPLGPLGRTDDDGPLPYAAAARIGELYEAAAVGQRVVVGDDQSDPFGDDRGVDGRLGDAGFPEHVGGTGVEGGGELFGGDFGEHARPAIRG